MKFSEQYKAEMQDVTLSDEQLERIRCGVYQKLSQPPQQTVRKKPLPLKVIAISGASAACVLLAAVAALNLSRVQYETAGDNMMFGGGAAMAPEMNYDTADNAFEGITASTAHNGSPASADQTSEGFSTAADALEIDIGSHIDKSPVSKPSHEPPQGVPQDTPHDKPHDSLNFGIPEDSSSGKAMIGFTDGDTVCTLTFGGIKQQFGLTDTDLTIDDAGGYRKIIAHSENGSEYTVVYFDENYIIVFDNNMQSIGIFKKLL